MATRKRVVEARSGENATETCNWERHDRGRAEGQTLALQGRPLGAVRGFVRGYDALPRMTPPPPRTCALLSFLRPQLSYYR